MANSVTPADVCLLDSEIGVPAGAGSESPLPAIEFYRTRLGFVPNHILALRPLARLIEAEWAITANLLFRECALTRRQKELILLAVSSARGNRYTAALYSHTLRALGVPPEQIDGVISGSRSAGHAGRDAVLIDFALKLTLRPLGINSADIQALRPQGFSEHAILEAVLTASWGGYLCTLCAGLGAEPDFEPPRMSPGLAIKTASQPSRSSKPDGPYIKGAENFPDSFPPFARVRRKWGFTPNLFRVQTLRPDLVKAELYALDLWLNTGDILTLRQKEYIFLAISAANLNTYCVVAHCEVLRVLGVPEQLSEQIAADHHRAGISEAEKLLIDACLKLTRRPRSFGLADKAALRQAGFSDVQILEAIVVAAISNFINTLNTGLGVTPDFEAKIDLNAAPAHPSPPERDHTEEMIATPMAIAADEKTDASCVARVQAGDAEAFEELVRRHGNRVYRTLSGILRQDADVEDAVQDTFVRAYRNIGKFEGRSKFSTWLTRIAINTGLQRLRGRKDLESLDDNTDATDDFRPRDVRAWQDDPEQLCSRTELKELLLNALAGLPLKYRLVVTLRDLQQLSTRETASAMGLEIPAVKARLFRGRLMLREALSPHFVKRDTARSHG